MKKIITITLIALAILVIATDTSSAKQNDLQHKLRNSLVSIDVYKQSYNYLYPWKKRDVDHSWYFGCAVSKDELLTTADAVINATYIKIKRANQNEFITAHIKAIDTSLNLCLLGLSQEQQTMDFTPIAFRDFEEGIELRNIWLDRAGDVKIARAYLDRAQVYESQTSHSFTLDFIAANVSQETGWGEIYTDTQGSVVGISEWQDSDSKESGMIPSEAIKDFLNEAQTQEYNGFGMLGFKSSDLIDPTIRNFLKLPADEPNGILVTDVFTIGTGSDILQKNDVILEIDSNPINAYGKFDHPVYRKIDFDFLITNKPVEEEISFLIYRNGEKKELTATVHNFASGEMLIPFFEHDIQPDYIIRGGLVIQKLTGNYLRLWGDDWPGKVPPYLYNLYQRLRFKPTEKRKEIIILSQVIPDDLNLGYQYLGRSVISKINGREIISMKDVFDAFEKNDAEFDVIEFEIPYPKIVLDRSKCSTVDNQIAMKYGITKLSNLNE